MMDKLIRNIPQEIVAIIQDKARKQKRSFNAEVIFILEDYIKAMAWDRAKKATHEK